MTALPTVLNIQIVNSTAAPTPKVLGKRPRTEDVQIDVSKPIPYPPTPEVVEALRLRILQLENELRGSKKQKLGGASVQAITPVASGSGAAAGSSSNKSEEKTKKTRAKSLFDQVKKAVKNEKYQGVLRTVKVEDHFSQADFELVFGGSGTLIQPTAMNKPTSKVWIREYRDREDFQGLFGDAYKEDQLKGYQWSVGSLYAGKSQKLGQVQLAIQSIEAQWSKNTEKVVLKVDIVEVGVDICMF